jgi:hypothetical protein
MNSTLTQLWTGLRRLAGPTYPQTYQLVYCPSCGLDLMNPVRWHELDESTWWMRLRCGGCGFVRLVDASNEQANQLDADLDRGLAVIAAAVTELERVEMAAVSDAFAEALERDLVTADDFRR